MFFELVPWVFRHLDFVCLANPEVIRLAVQEASSSQVLGLTLSGANFFLGDGNDSEVADCLSATREWDEQEILWVSLLLSAEGKRLGMADRVSKILSAAFKSESSRVLPPAWRLALLGIAF